MDKIKLTFGKANAKLRPLQNKVGKLYTFSLLAGVSCPGAKDCKSHVENGKIVDGKFTLFRCFSASQEAIFPNVFKSRRKNLEMIKSCGNNIDKMKDLILSSIPKDAKCIRIHVSGDMFTKNYFLAWCYVASERPDILFYCYTKSIPFVIKCKDAIPGNLKITCSYGGNYDNLIDEHNLKRAYVVHESNEARLVKRYNAKHKMPKGSKYAGLRIDHDDSLAVFSNDSFVLLVHNIMPSGSDASKAVSILDGVGSYK